MARETFEGTLTVHRQQKRARGGLLAAYLTETLAPEFYPPKGWIVVPKPHYEHWQVRFKRLPESLHGCHGHRVRITCTPVPFSNDAGVYATRAKVECLDEAEHVLTALERLK